MPIMNTVNAPSIYIEKYNDNGTLKNKFQINTLDGITSLSDYVLQGAMRGVTASFQIVDLSKISSVGQYSLANCFSGCSSITGTANFDSLEEITTRYALDNILTDSSIANMSFPILKKIYGIYSFRSVLNGATNITDISLPSLKIVGGYYAMAYCFANSSIKTLDLGSLEIASGMPASGTNNGYTLSYLCQNCTALTSVDIKLLTYITDNCTYGFYNAFAGCSALTELRFSSLKEILAGTTGCFYYAFNQSGVQNVYFPAIDRIMVSQAFNNMLFGTTGIKLHFPANRTSLISGLTGYPNFGGTNASIMFDLPSTFKLTGANSINYVRNPKYDTESALAWRKDQIDVEGLVSDWTPYYTSGTTDPNSGDTIYSDSACTTAVTTISSIS